MRIMIHHPTVPHERVRVLRPGPQQASDDATVPHAADNRGSTIMDPDQERELELPKREEEDDLAVGAPMDGKAFILQLRLLAGTIEQLHAGFVHERVDGRMMAEINVIMASGLVSAPRSAHLAALLDVLRADLEGPRETVFGKAMRDCERMKTAIEKLIDTSVRPAEL
jgi:hypothetical protein